MVELVTKLLKNDPEATLTAQWVPSTGEVTYWANVGGESYQLSKEDFNQIVKGLK